MKYQVGDSVIVNSPISTCHDRVVTIISSVFGATDLYRVDMNGTTGYFYECELIDILPKPQKQMSRPSNNPPNIVPAPITISGGGGTISGYNDVPDNLFGIPASAMGNPCVSAEVKLNVPKCECGVAFCGGGLHSSWCPIKN